MGSSRPSPGIKMKDGQTTAQMVRTSGRAGDATPLLSLFLVPFPWVLPFVTAALLAVLAPLLTAEAPDVAAASRGGSRKSRQYCDSCSFSGLATTKASTRSLSGCSCSHFSAALV